MKNKKSLFNAALLVLMGIAFAVITFLGKFQLEQAAQNFRQPADVPSLCFEEANVEENIFKGGYLCNSAGEKVSSMEDYAMFINGQVNFAAHVRSYELITIEITIGSMFTIASFVGAVICLNNGRRTK